MFDPVNIAESAPTHVTSFLVVIDFSKRSQSRVLAMWQELQDIYPQFRLDFFATSAQETGDSVDRNVPMLTSSSSLTKNGGRLNVGRAMVADCFDWTKAGRRYDWVYLKYN